MLEAFRKYQQEMLQRENGSDSWCHLVQKTLSNKRRMQKVSISWKHECLQAMILSASDGGAPSQSPV